LRARLTVDYIEQSMLLYRNTRTHVRELLDQAIHAGYDRVQIVGEGDIADVCRLSCLEQGIRVVNDDHVPKLVIYGLKVQLMIEE
jgi:hypothetical protein